MSILLYLLCNLLLSFFKLFFSLSYLLDHRFNLRLELSALPLLLFIELTLEGNLFALEVGNVAVERCINLIDFVEVLLDSI